MKKLLLATAAFALIAPAAQAEIKLDLGGFFKGYAGYSNQDEDDLREFDVKRKSEITFTGETTLDNGLTVGYAGELIQENADVPGDVDNDQIETSYLYFSGNWGRVNLGRNYGAAYLLQVAAPGADSNVDGMDNSFSFYNQTSGVDQDYQHNGIASRSQMNDSITYLTPKFNGFQAGVTYSAAVDQKNRPFAPYGAVAGLGSTSGMEGDAGVNDLENQIEAALRYDGEFNGVGIHAGAGYTTIGEEVSSVGSDDYQEWNAGLKFTWNNFGLGTAYNTDNGQADDDADTDNWVVGADYTWGAYVFGASYFRSENENVAADEDQLDRISVGATYTFGPGMDFRGAVAFYDEELAGAAANDATVVTVGTDIQF
jgi:outer membrane protein OmpU